MAAHAKPRPTIAASTPKSTNLSLASPNPLVAAAKAKTHLLQLLDQVERERRPITITKRGRAVAQLVPVPPESNVSKFDQVFGSMAGTVKILGDIVSPDWESWGPEWR